ncbi:MULTISPECIES: hypothetical protein [unclassified Brenneria]|uniref:hypothetical protein n=1 Tax=unclassified Brenneria TaxID=2634434 RepID=UPI0029C4227D|nr:MULTISPECIES: hypothetical protein [unclassified Brenneria]MDX5627778.1 hypothetical protein [Brenneria sp. L3-3Z]MDX5695131.1 hypothetical protein [Brenneria sp. L4-2C]
MQKLRYILGLIVMLSLSQIAGIGGAYAETPRPPIANTVKAYQGTEGAQVWTLRVGEADESQALVQITGIDHDWNSKIQKMNVEKLSSSTRYWLNVNDKKFVALILNQGYGELYLPGEAQPVQIGYSKDLSDQGNAEAFLTDYLQQAGNN